MENKDEMSPVNNSGLYETEPVSKGGPFRIILILLATVLLSGTAALATRAWDPHWNPFGQSPEEVLGSALARTMEENMMRSETKLKVNLRTDEGSMGFEILLNSESDTSDPENPRFKSELELAFFGQGLRMFFAGEAIGLDDVLYFKADTIPLPITVNMMAIGMDPDQWRGRWISVDPRDTGMSFTPDRGLERKVAELIEEYPILRSGERLPDATINDRKAYHYLFTFDEDNMREFLLGLIEYQAGGIGINDDDEIRMIAELIADLPVEVYIDKKDLLIRKVSASNIFEISNFWFEGEAEVGLEIGLSRFGEPVEISEPENPTSFLDLFGFLFEGMGINASRQTAMDARIMSALGQTRAVAELIYSRDKWQYDNICSSPTSLEISDTRNGLDFLQREIIDSGGMVACYAAGKDYCVSSALNESGQFWCVNSAGRSGKSTTACTSVNTGCAGLGF